MKIIRYLSIIILLSSCATYKFNNSDFQGTYIRPHFNEKLTFTGTKFANIERGNGHLALFYCCDTIASGTWGIDKDRGLIYLNSPPRLLASFIGLDVKEETYNQDSLTFIIDNPIEEQYKKDNGRKRDINYRLFLWGEAGLLDAKFGVIDNKTNYIKVPKLKNGIAKFSIMIFPKDNYKGRDISTRQVDTEDYEIKNSTSNVFHINLSDLTDGFISYLRLEKDFIKVLSKNELEWHDKIYVKSNEK